MPFCVGCGTELEPYDKFCGKCGQRFKEAAEPIEQEREGLEFELPGKLFQPRPAPEKRNDWKKLLIYTASFLAFAGLVVWAASGFDLLKRKPSGLPTPGYPESATTPPQPAPPPMSTGIDPKTGRIMRGWIGLQVTDITPELAQQLGIRDREGVLVQSVESGGPAEEARLRAGDILMEVNRQPVSKAYDLSRRISETLPGDNVLFLVSRKGRTFYVAVKVGQRQGNF